MPTYAFEDEITGEQHEAFLSMSERLTYLADNPNLKQIITHAPRFSGDTVGLGLTKNDSGFNDMMKPIGDANPNSKVDKQYNTRSSKRIAIDKVANKHGFSGGKG